MFGDKKKLVMCQTCRGLIAASERTCPLCGRDSVPPAPVAFTRTQNPRFFTLLLIGINVVIYVVMVAVSIKAGSPDPVLNGAGQSVLRAFGDRYLPAIANGEVWRLITPMFIHLGLMHLGFNLTALYQIGPMVEEAYGSPKFIFVYILTGLVGNIGSYVFHISGAGASGAIYGLIGISAVYGYKIGGSFGRALGKQMLIWAGIGMVLSLVFHWDYVNHGFGMATGAALGYLLAPGEAATNRSATLWNGVAVACAVVILASFGMVALHYGKTAEPQDVILLDRRVSTLEQSLKSSFEFNSEGSGDPKKIAADLRSAADDVARTPRIDKRGDQITSGLVDLANRRAREFDSADKDPSAINNNALADAQQTRQLLDQYSAWVDSILTDYGLYRDHTPQ